MSGFSQYLVNKLHDFLHREQAFDPPATVYVALCTSAPTRAAAGTEVNSGTHPTYARVALTHSAANITNTQNSGTGASTGTGTTVQNVGAIDFGTAGSNWGSPSPVGWWETYDAASGGNRLEYGTIVDGTGAAAPRSIASGDPVVFPAGAFKYGLA